jgi:hypothetical protein
VQERRSASAAFGYQYIGRMEVEGRLTVHLSKGGKLYPVRVGDVLEGLFRVEGIKADGLELTYLPQKSRQFVAFSTIAPPAPQANVVARPEAQPQQPHVAIHPPAVPVGPGVPTVPSVGGEPGAPARAQTMEAAPATPMSISPPVSQMPVGPPTVSTMPTLPPVNDMPVSQPSGATMATTPSSGGM